MTVSVQSAGRGGVVCVRGVNTCKTISSFKELGHPNNLPVIATSEQWFVSLGCLGERRQGVTLNVISHHS